MLLFATLVMAAVAAVNYRFSRSLIYPPSLLATVWTVLLLLLLANGNVFYPISPQTMVVYLVGAVAFSLGGIFPSSVFARATPHTPPRVGRRPGALVLTGGLVLLVLALPLFWEYIQDMADSAANEDFWYAVRGESIAQSDEWSSKTFVSLILENLSTLAALLAMTAVAEHDRSRFSLIRMSLILLVALLYQMMNAASAGAVALAMGLIGIDAVRQRRLRTKVLVIGLSVAVAAFAIVGVGLNKGKTEAGASAVENFSAIVELVALYTVGGVVAFDAVVQYPASVPPVWSMWRVFLLTANKFGARFDVPSLHAQYTEISNDYGTNVYSIYFAYYPDYGLAGVGLIMLVLGAILTLVYQKAIRGNPRALVLYASVFSGILLSGFSEYFLLTINFWFKAVVYTTAIYGLGIGRASPEYISKAEGLNAGLPGIPVRQG